MSSAPLDLTSVDACVDEILKTVGKEIVLGVPLALGKPNQLINALYQRAKDNPDISLRIITALSLEKPKPSNDIEARFLEPFVERLFGDYVELEYMQAIRSNSLPDNITVSEFYFKAGSMKNVPVAQCNYISTNYTFVARDLIDNGVNVLAQLVAEQEINGETKLSLSCNPDVTLDILPLLRQERAKGKNIVIAAVVHNDLPFMYNRAIVEPSEFDIVIRNEEYSTTLFAPPNMSVPPQDFVAGLHASTLLKDGGTIQIGIGSLGDAIVYAAKLRQEQNDFYKKAVNQIGIDERLVADEGGLDAFETGLYGSSEMFVNGFRYLIDAGIVKRKVYDDLPIQSLLNAGEISEAVDQRTVKVLIEAGAVSAVFDDNDLKYLQHWGVIKPEAYLENHKLIVDGVSIDNDFHNPGNYQQLCDHGLSGELQNGIYMHGGFFLGPKDFYQYLRDMPYQQSKNICMSSVGHINQLTYDSPLLSAQRRDARFINTGMMVTLSGSVVSDGLENGTVVSGVGGQYNFVAMAHHLPDARSILCVRSTRGSGKHAKSNIVPFYGHITIPRHLRDIIVTEYGVANLRGKTDEEVAIELIKVADSRFQEELLEFAKANGKIAKDYQLPDKYRSNTPQGVQELVGQWRDQGYFPAFPLGTDLTEEEIAIGKSLKDIKALMENPRQLVKAIVRAIVHDVDEGEAQHYLERMQLAHPNTAKETLIQHLLLLELEDNGYLRPI
ncbi:MAG: acetyl-CoA hydrolase [Pseudomonadales bacterium]|nr:acetyl-CoA hydrolase [Pseudomonadales bacterium]